MRTYNGQFTNRLPPETQNQAKQIGMSVGKSVGAAALQAVLVVTAARVVDAVFTAIADRRRRRSEQVEPHDVDRRRARHGSPVA